MNELAGQDVSAAGAVHGYRAIAALDVDATAIDHSVKIESISSAAHLAMANPFVPLSTNVPGGAAGCYLFFGHALHWLRVYLGLGFVVTL